MPVVFLRYVNVHKVALAPVIWSQLGRGERSTGLTFALLSYSGADSPASGPGNSAGDPTR